MDRALRSALAAEAHVVAFSARMACCRTDPGFEIRSSLGMSPPTTQYDSTISSGGRSNGECPTPEEQTPAQPRQMRVQLETILATGSSASLQGHSWSALAECRRVSDSLR